MVIHTGGKRRRGTRAGAAPSLRAKGHGAKSPGARSPHAGGATRLDATAVLRFAPNFSVYVLPAGSVCLYSEDRKFFLHGELYCALADAIGRGGARVRDLMRALE